MLFANHGEENQFCVDVMLHHSSNARSIIVACFVCCLLYLFCCFIAFSCSLRVMCVAFLLESLSIRTAYFILLFVCFASSMLPRVCVIALAFFCAGGAYREIVSLNFVALLFSFVA